MWRHSASYNPFFSIIDWRIIPFQKTNHLRCKQFNFLLWNDLLSSIIDWMEVIHWIKVIITVVLNEDWTYKDKQEIHLIVCFYWWMTKLRQRATPFHSFHSMNSANAGMNWIEKEWEWLAASERNSTNEKNAMIWVKLNDERRPRLPANWIPLIELRSFQSLHSITLHSFPATALVSNQINFSLRSGVSAHFTQ